MLVLKCVGDAERILPADRRFVAEMTLSVPPYLSADSRRNVNAAVILNQLLRPGATMGVNSEMASRYSALQAMSR